MLEGIACLRKHFVGLGFVSVRESQVGAWKVGKFWNLRKS